MAIVGVVVALSAATAWSAPNTTVKPYELAHAQPTSVPAATSATFSVDITNRSDQQQLGSVNISVPEFRVTSANAADGGASATFRNLSLAPGATTTLAFTAVASCKAGTYAWVVKVKQSNDFNGPPGNDFVPSDSSETPSTSITGSCRLAFNNQPADTSGPGVVITSVPLSTTGAPVSVRVLDDNGNPTTITGVPIALGLSLNGGGATGFGAATTTVTGVATFPGISLNRYGLYRFNATSPGLTTATSTLFNVWQQVTNCAVSCSLTSSVTNGFSSTLTSTASNGNLGVSLGGRTKPTCGPDGVYDTEFNHAPNTVTGNAYGAAATGDKTVTLVVEKKVDQQEPNNGASFYQVCYAAPLSASPAPDVIRPGTVAVQDPTTQEWVWVLPDCSPQLPTGTACVASRTKDNAGRVFVVFRLAAGDPTWW